MPTDGSIEFPVFDGRTMHADVPSLAALQVVPGHVLVWATDLSDRLSRRNGVLRYRDVEFPILRDYWIEGDYAWVEDVKTKTGVVYGGVARSFTYLIVGMRPTDAAALMLLGADVVLVEGDRWRHVHQGITFTLTRGEHY